MKSVLMLLTVVLLCCVSFAAGRRYSSHAYSGTAHVMQGNELDHLMTETASRK